MEHVRNADTFVLDLLLSDENSNTKFDRIHLLQS